MASPRTSGRFDGAMTRTFSLQSTMPTPDRLSKEEREQRAKQHALKLAKHYKRAGSASYRSTSDRFGCSADASMQGRKAAENPRLAESPLVDRACIGLYVRGGPPPAARHPASRLRLGRTASTTCSQACVLPSPPCAGGHPA